MKDVLRAAERLARSARAKRVLEFFEIKEDVIQYKVVFLILELRVALARLLRGSDCDTTAHINPPLGDSRHV